MDYIFFFDGNIYVMEFKVFKEVFFNSVYLIYDYVIMGFLFG